MRNHADTQQTASGTLTWHCFALCFPYHNLYCISSALWTRMFTFVQTVFFSFKTFSASPLSPKVGFRQRSEESKIKDRILVIKAPRVPCWPRRRFKCSVPLQPVGPCRKSKGLSPLSDSLPEAITVRIRGKAGIQPRAAVYTASYLKHKHFI